jgi:hypothetical protein
VSISPLSPVKLLESIGRLGSNLAKKKDSLCLLAL